MSGALESAVGLLSSRHFAYNNIVLSTGCVNYERSLLSSGLCLLCHLSTKLAVDFAAHACCSCISFKLLVCSISTDAYVQSMYLGCSTCFAYTLNE